VPAGHKTAVKGAWVAGPGRHLFDALRAALGPLPIIAEDLGVITPDVEALRDNFGFPGMKILQFAFGSGPANSYLPHNHINNCVVYTGTHDNDTSSGWFQGLNAREQLEVQEYLGAVGGDPVDDLVRAAFASVANTAIVPFQDLLGLPSAARMNVPGTPDGNWEWRFSWDMIDKGLAARIRHKLEIFGRCQHQSV